MMRNNMIKERQKIINDIKVLVALLRGTHGEQEHRELKERIDECEEQLSKL